MVEAKWLHDIDACQGHSRNTTQLAMRSYLARQGVASDEQAGVLVIVPRPDRYPPARKPDSTFRRYFAVDDGRYRALPAADALSARAVTWEQVAAILLATESHEQTAEYLSWRTKMLPQRS